MKQYREDIWVDEQANGTINVGFAQSFINRKMMECFHVLQADTRRVEKDGPMLVIETNDALESIKAPIAGAVDYFNPKARNFPDRLKEDDVILTIRPPNVKRADPVAEEVPRMEWAIGWEDLNPNQQQLRREAEARAIARARRILNNNNN